MKITPLTPREIAKNLNNCLPIVILSSILYVLIFGALLFGLGQNWLSKEHAKIFGFTVSALLVFLGTVLYLRALLSRLARSFIEIKETSLIVNAPRSLGAWRIVPVEFPFSQIKRVDIHHILRVRKEKSNTIGAIALGRKKEFINAMQDLKDNQITVQNSDGKLFIFHYVGKIFSHAEITTLILELKKRITHLDGAA